jgi:hypothetical protein
MKKSLEERIHEIDRQIIHLYDLIETNGEKSFPSLERQIKKVKNHANSENSKTYKFQCRDCDWKSN